MLTITAMMSGMASTFWTASSSWRTSSIVPNVWLRLNNQRLQADGAKTLLTVADGDHLTLLNVYNQYMQSKLSIESHSIIPSYCLFLLIRYAWQELDMDALPIPSCAAGSRQCSCAATADNGAPWYRFAVAVRRAETVHQHPASFGVRVLYASCAQTWREREFSDSEGQPGRFFSSWLTGDSHSSFWRSLVSIHPAVWIPNLSGSSSTNSCWQLGRTSAPCRKSGLNGMLSLLCEKLCSTNISSRLLQYAGNYFDLSTFPDGETTRALQRVIKKRNKKAAKSSAKIDSRKDDRKAVKQRAIIELLELLWGEGIVWCFC